MSGPEPTADVRDSIERCWREGAAIDEALERGDIDEGEWFRRCQALVVPAYLAAESPFAQAGHSGDVQRWELARRHVLEAVNQDGTFLDVGCANGMLMETLHGWAREDGLAIEPYGLELSPELPSSPDAGCRTGPTASSSATPSTGRRRAASPSSALGSSTFRSGATAISSVIYSTTCASLVGG